MLWLEIKPGWPSGSREIQRRKTKRASRIHPTGHAVMPSTWNPPLWLQLNVTLEPHGERKTLPNFFPCHYFLDLKRRQTLMLLKGLRHRAGGRELAGAQVSIAALALIFRHLWKAPTPAEYQQPQAVLLCQWLIVVTRALQHKGPAFTPPPPLFLTLTQPPPHSKQAFWMRWTLE